ncbi:MAG: hypothetical protein FJW31_29150 [Acidobacteria bacterium]|nr:hypothetical protein [Acidobacteriota bacterium]
MCIAISPGLEAAQRSQMAGGAAFKVTLVAMQPVKRPSQRFIEEGGGRRGRGFVLRGEDFAFVLGGAHEIGEGLECAEAFGSQFFPPSAFEFRVDGLRGFAEAQVAREPTGGAGILG